MEEKILIRSVRSKKAYWCTIAYLYTILVMSALLFSLLFSAIFGFETFGMCFRLWLLGFAPFIFVINLILAKTFKRCGAVVTDDTVTVLYGLNGRIDIPIVSLKHIVINDSVFRQSIGFLTVDNTVHYVRYVENRKEILEVVDRRMTEIQSTAEQNTENDTASHKECKETL